MTKYYIQISGKADSKGKTVEELKESLRQKAEKHFRLENLQVMNWGKVKE